jgi:hypothetical protein
MSELTEKQMPVTAAAPTAEPLYVPADVKEQISGCRGTGRARFLRGRVTEDSQPVTHWVCRGWGEARARLPSRCRGMGGRVRRWTTADRVSLYRYRTEE